jgi:hypothetical protein
MRQSPIGHTSAAGLPPSLPLEIPAYLEEWLDVAVGKDIQEMRPS